MNKELMKKAYEDFNGVWPYNVPDGMAVRNGEYANVPSGDIFNYREWNWVGTKADFEAYGESLRSSKINWDEAPEGATAYCDSSRLPWLKKDSGGEVSFYNEAKSRWQVYATPSNGESHYSDAVKKPQSESTAWQPKIGEECEANIYGYWIKILFLAYGKKTFLYEILDDQTCPNGDVLGGELSALLSESKFRPIKTERDQLIEIIDSCNMSSGVLADAILSAGYRKTEEEK